MKYKPWALVPVLAFLSSCVIVNPVYPQDELNLETYSEPITLDWSNNEEEQSQDTTFSDDEELRSYLNASHAAIKKINEQTNLYRGRGALGIGTNGTDKKGVLSFTLKNTFLADALVVYVYPYHTESFDMFTGKTVREVDRLGIAINDRPYIDIVQNDDDEAIALTFHFTKAISEVNISSKSGRGMLFGIDIYQEK